MYKVVLAFSPAHIFSCQSFKKMCYISSLSLSMCTRDESWFLSHIVCIKELVFLWVREMVGKWNDKLTGEAFKVRKRRQFVKRFLLHDEPCLRLHPFYDFSVLT